VGVRWTAEALNVFVQHKTSDLLLWAAFVIASAIRCFREFSPPHLCPLTNVGQQVQTNLDQGAEDESRAIVEVALRVSNSESFLKHEFAVKRPPPVE
jgi:hypothetical protein